MVPARAVINDHFHCQLIHLFSSQLIDLLFGQ